MTTAAEYDEMAEIAASAARRMRKQAREHAADPDLSEMFTAVAVDNENMALHYRNLADI